MVLSTFLYAPMFDFIFGVVFPLKPKLCLGQIMHFCAGLGKLNESGG